MKRYPCQNTYGFFLIIIILMTSLILFRLGVSKLNHMYKTKESASLLYFGTYFMHNVEKQFLIDDDMILFLCSIYVRNHVIVYQNYSYIVHKICVKITECSKLFYITVLSIALFDLTEEKYDLTILHIETKIKHYFLCCWIHLHSSKQHFNWWAF